MNLLNAQGILSPTNLLLLGGLSLLLLNIAYGLIRTSRGNVNAGRLTIVTVFLACGLVIIGSVQVASASSAAVSSRTQRGGGPAQAAPLPSSAATVAPENTSAAPAASPTDSAAASSTPAATAVGTPARRRGTPGAAANAGTQSNAAAGGSAAGTNNATSNADSPAAGTANPTTGPLNSATGSSDNSGPTLMLAIAGLAVILSAVLYLIERRRPAFNWAASRGLLNLGGAAFIIIALQIIPMIPAQFNSVNAAAPSATRSGGFAARGVITATPTATELPTETPTLIPTFTPTATVLPEIQPTQISYVNAQPIATVPGNQSAALKPDAATNCSVTATNNLNLRGDPSTTHPLLLTIPAGTSLAVSAISPDKAWWKISYDGASGATTGWVSAQYTTTNGKCSTVPTRQS